MIARLWHGWTRPENADAYEEFLRTEMFPSIHSVDGFLGADQALVEPEARRLLARFDERSEHFEIRIAGG